jgi:ribulose-5-phosphate 4-epimerase/fuculose-1-phosphate aldolase
MQLQIDPVLISSQRERVPAEEWQARTDLAACYRLMVHFRMTDLIYTHISARIPGTEQILINGFGLMFDEVTASNLVKIDLDGTIVDDPTGLGINNAGYVIHSAVHGARPDVACVIHAHTSAQMAVSADEEGLLPLTQHAMRFYGRIGYHDYEGIALDASERERLVADLGSHDALILRNHGTLTCGTTVGAAFTNMYYLERACQAQVMAQSTGRPLRMPSQASIDNTVAIFARASNTRAGRDWGALQRLADREYPDYRT